MHLSTPSDWVERSGALMAWAVTSNGRKATYIGNLSREQTGLACECICPACGGTQSNLPALESSAMRVRLLLPTTLISMAMASSLCHAQNLPPVSRTVFKCQVAGKTVYSDAPCLGAKQINVEPTRGLNQTSGRVQTGADVAREHNREMFAEAVRPLTGKDAKQLAVLGRRNKLSPEVQRECPRLDGDLAAAQQDEKKAAPSDLKEVQMKLFQMRKRFQELGC